MTTSETPGVEAPPADASQLQSTVKTVAKAAAGAAVALTRGPLLAGYSAGRSAYRLGREVMAKRAAARGDTSGKLSTGAIVAVAAGATVVGVGVAAVVLARRNEPAPPAAAPPSLREVTPTEPSRNGSGPVPASSPAPAPATTAVAATEEPAAEEVTVRDGIEPEVDEVVTVEDPSVSAAPEDTAVEEAAVDSTAVESTGDDGTPVEEAVAETAVAEEPAVEEAVDAAAVTETLPVVEAPADVTASPSTNGRPAGADRTEG